MRSVSRCDSAQPNHSWASGEPLSSQEPVAAYPTTGLVMPDVDAVSRFSTPQSPRESAPYLAIDHKRLQCCRSATNRIHRAGRSEVTFLLLRVMTQTKGPVRTSPFSFVRSLREARYPARSGCTHAAKQCQRSKGHNIAPAWPSPGRQSCTSRTCCSMAFRSGALHAPTPAFATYSKKGRREEEESPAPA